MDINKLTLGYKAVDYTKLKNEDKKETENKKEADVKQADKQVPADKVLEFLNSASVAIRPVKAVSASKVTPESADRIAASMEEFEKIFAVAEAEFGEEAALAILDKMCD